MNNQVIDKAISLIKERGWCQGKYVDDGKLCLKGAIHHALNGDDFSILERGEFGVILEELRDKCPAPRGTTWTNPKTRTVVQDNLVIFNDDPNRTAEEVIAFLEGAKT